MTQCGIAMPRDLRWLRDSVRALDRVFFSGDLEARDIKIRWMRWRPLKRHFLFGTYCDGVIELNRALAHEWVPDHVVLLTIYHEALHAVVGDEHDHAFLTAEQRFPHYAVAREWETANVVRLKNATRPDLRPEAAE